MAHSNYNLSQPLSSHKQYLPKSIDELADCVTQPGIVIPHGNKTKPGLTNANIATTVTHIDLTGLSGVLQYEPDEFVFTALAGTPVAEISNALCKHDQFLPFDPPWASSGATLGGTVAAGLNGPGQFRYGGLREFIIGAKFINGTGKRLKGGGKVVKNAAGFDFPKLFVGSIGRLGILYELTFKVFPAPQAYMTLSFSLGNIPSAIDAACALAGSNFEPFSIDITPPGRLDIRFGGNHKANEITAGLVEAFLDLPAHRSTGEEEAALWNSLRDLTWAKGNLLLKIALVPSMVDELDRSLEKLNALRHYSAAGNVAFVDTDKENLQAIDAKLKAMKLSGIVLRGNIANPRLGWQSSGKAEAIIQSAMDREGKFLPL